MSREAKIITGVLVLVVAAMIGLFVATGSGNKPASTGPTTDASKLFTPSSHSIGGGQIKVVEFGDYQCPACGQAYPITKDLLKEYDGKISLIFRNFPLAQLHKNALTSAYAAEAAAKQNKFWEMHDKLYETQPEWSEKDDAPDIFVGYATQLGLNVDQFKQDVASDAIKKVVADDKIAGDALGITGTPTFYVNGQKAADFNKDTLKSLIDSAK